VRIRLKEIRRARKREEEQLHARIKVLKAAKAATRPPTRPTRPTAGGTRSGSTTRPSAAPRPSRARPVAPAESHAPD